MPPIWSYTPQGILAETLTADVRRVTLSPQAEISGQVTPALMRSWRLRYTAISTAECSSMAAFYAAQQGSYLPFTFISPNDQRSYEVRFAAAFVSELFQADRLALGADLLLVATSAAVGIMLSEEWGYGELGYGGDTSEVAPKQSYGGR